MIELETAVLAKRLLNGTADLGDIDRLLINLREPAKGFAIVRDMGDFVAHYGEREKGLILEVANPTLAIVRMYAQRELKVPVSREQAQWAFRSYGALGQRRLSPAERARLPRLLERACAAVQGHDGERWHFTPELAAEDIKLLNKVSQTKLKSAFDQKGYVQQVLAALKQLQMVSPEAKFGPNSEGARLLAKHAVVRMHGASIRTPTNDKIKLWATFDHRIHVGAALPFKTPDKDLFIGVLLFDTDLDPQTECDPPLNALGNQQWRFPLDLKGGKIAPLM